MFNGTRYKLYLTINTDTYVGITYIDASIIKKLTCHLLMWLI